MNVRYIILSYFIFLTSCTGLLNTGGSDLAYLYSPYSNTIQPLFSYLHEDELVSRIKVSVPADDLLYVRDAREEYYLSRFEVSITVLSYPGQRKPVYSSTLEFMDTLLIIPDRIVEQELTFPLETGNHYWLYLGFDDKNRRKSHSSLLIIDKQSSYSRGFFNSINHLGDTLLFHPFGFFSAEGIITIRSRANAIEKLEVNCFTPVAQFPAAPFHADEEGDYEREYLSMDSSTIVHGNEQGVSVNVSENGVFRINEPGNMQNGFSIINIWDGFPLMPDDERYLHPLRYISTSAEFERMLQLNDPQLAAERFWIRTTGNPDRAAAVMNRYVNRVVKTNELFTSHLPGWQTDRGMIYIVFGPPDQVFHSREGETWRYSQTMQTPDAELFFRRNENILSNNDLILIRNISYERFWNTAVENWRR